MAFTREDEQFMLEALRLAGNGRGAVEPNPMVGAILVRDGKVIGRGFHRAYGEAHAEVECLRDARSKGEDVRGATMYVTLEPCSHRGKTPPCANRLVEEELKRVVIATEDPLWAHHAGSDGKGESPRGLELLREAGIETEVGLCRDRARMLNAAFMKRSARNMPLVIAKWAMSADGKIATHTGSSRWISCEQSRARVHKLRGMVDGVMVGSGTALRDDPRLTCRMALPRRHPSRIVLCGESVPRPDSALLRTLSEGEVILVHIEHAPPEHLEPLVDAGCEAVGVPADENDGGRVDVRAVLQRMGERGMSNVLVEGGSEVFGSLFDAGLVDRVMIFVASGVVGGAGAVTAVGGDGVKTMGRWTALLGDVTTGDRRKPPAEPVTRVELCGRDILINGWTTDPRVWGNK